MIVLSLLIPSQTDQSEAIKVLFTHDFSLFKSQKIHRLPFSSMCLGVRKRADLCISTFSFLFFFSFNHYYTRFINLNQKQVCGLGDNKIIFTACHHLELRKIREGRGRIIEGAIKWRERMKIGWKERKIKVRFCYWVQ